MSESEGVFLFVATYPDEAAAREDYGVVKALKDLDVIHRYDAAVVTKDDKGKIHLDKDETSTRKGAWTGIGAGAVLGLLFPPSIVGTALVLGAAGGFAGHLWGGLSRKDVKELGDFIDDGQAALLVIGDVDVSKALEQSILHADKMMTKQVHVDPKALDEAAAADA